MNVGIHITNSECNWELHLLDIPRHGKHTRMSSEAGIKQRFAIYSVPVSSKKDDVLTAPAESRCANGHFKVGTTKSFGEFLHAGIACSNSIDKIPWKECVHHLWKVITSSMGQYRLVLA
jgi:hypothetical protein